MAKDDFLPPGVSPGLLGQIISKPEFYHITGRKECGKVRKLIDDDGNMYYKCDACQKLWIIGEKAQPK